MADNTIDTLELQINSNSTKAVKSLDNLAKKLYSLNNAFKSVDNGGLRNYSREIGKVSASIKSLNGIRMSVPNLSGLTKQLTNLSNINFAALNGSGNSLKDLASGLSAISGFQNISVPKVDTKNINSVTKAIEKLGKVDSSNAQQTINSIQKVAHSMSVLNTVDFGESKIIPGINAIRRLMDVKTADFDTGALDRIAISIGTFSSIPDVSQSLNRFLSSLQKLVNAGGSIGTVTSELPGLSLQLKNAVEQMASASAVSEPVNLFVQSIGRLADAGSKTGQTAIQLSTLSKEVLAFFNAMKGAPEISENTIRMTEALANLANVSGKVSSATNSITNSFSRLSSVTKGLGNIGSKLANMIGSAGAALAEFGSAATSTSKKTGNLVSQFAGLYAKFFTVTRGVKTLWNSVESASDYVETLNYFNSAFEQVTDGLDISKWQDAGVNSAEEYVGSFEKKAKELTKKLTGFEVSNSGDLTRTKAASLGLDPNQTMNYQATYAQMASSMGATADTATKLSQALTEIGADLASVKNLDFEDVWQDMASGMTGMSRALDKYGINIRVANLQQELYNLGIDTTVSKLSQTDKAILRTITVLNSTKYAWGDLASTINQPANQIRLLQSNFSALSRTIGSLFIPIVTKVLPYLNALVIAIQKVFSGIGNLLGIKLSDYTSSTGSAAIDMSDIADSTEDAANGLENANKNATKLKKTLSVLSFDELNQLNSASQSGNTSNSANNALKAHIPELDAALDKALSEYQAAWDEAFEGMNNKANETADKIVAVFKKIQKAAIPTTKALKKLYDNGLKKLGNFSITALKDLWNNYLKPMGNWMLSDKSGLPRFFTITNDLLNKINWSKLNSSLSSFFTMLQKPTQFVWTGLMDFYEHFLVPVGTWTMNSAIPELVDALTNFGNNIHWDDLNSSLKNFWEALTPFAQNVGQGIVDFFKDLLNIGESFINITVPGGLNSIADAIKNINPETAKAIGKGLAQISIAILGFKGLTFIGEIIGKDSPLGKGLKVLAKHPYAAMALGLVGIVTALDNFGIIDVDWEWIWDGIDRVKTAIQNFIDKVNWSAVGDALGNLWSGFQPFAEGFADALITGLEGLINVGAGLINGVADAINWLAGILSGVDPEFIKQVGEALGILFQIKIAKDIASKIFSFASGIGSLAAKIKLFTEGNPSTVVDTIKDIGEAADGASGGFGNLEGSIKNLGDTAQTAGGQFQGFWGYATNLGATAFVIDGLQHVKQAMDFKESTADAFNDFEVVRKALKILEEQTGISGDKLIGLGGDLGKVKDGSFDFDQQLQTVITTLENAGISSDQFKDALKKAMEDTDTSSNKHLGSLNRYISGTSDAFGIANTAISAAMLGIQNSTKNAMSSAQSNVKTATDRISSDSQTNWGLASDFATGALGEIDQETYNTMQKVYGVIRRWNEAIEDSFGQNWVLGKDKAISALVELRSNTENEVSSISNVFDSIKGKLENSFSGLYAIGRNAMLNFKNGIESVHINTPHLTMDYVNWQQGNTHKWRWNSSVKWYAKGGLFDTASVIGIGEKGKEAALPLENRRTMKAIADSIVSSSGGTMGLSKEELTQAVAQGVAMAMSMNSGNKNPQYIMNSIILDGSEIAKAVSKAQKDTNSRFQPSPAY